MSYARPARSDHETPLELGMIPGPSGLWAAWFGAEPATPDTLCSVQFIAADSEELAEGDADGSSDASG
jgi:hypothetical protein